MKTDQALGPIELMERIKARRAGLLDLDPGKHAFQFFPAFRVSSCAWSQNETLLTLVMVLQATLFPSKTEQWVGDCFNNSKAMMTLNTTSLGAQIQFSVCELHFHQSFANMSQTAGQSQEPSSLRRYLFYWGLGGLVPL